MTRVTPAKPGVKIVQNETRYRKKIPCRKSLATIKRQPRAFRHFTSFWSFVSGDRQKQWGWRWMADLKNSNKRNHCPQSHNCDAKSKNFINQMPRSHYTFQKQSVNGRRNWCLTSVYRLSNSCLEYSVNEWIQVVVKIWMKRGIVKKK